MASNLTTAKLLTTGDLRTFLANIAVAVAQNDMDIRNAVVAVKACEQINASLYSEAKIAALTMANGQTQGGKPAPLGRLPLRDEVVQRVA
jgi:hypothetical protein